MAGDQLKLNLTNQFNRIPIRVLDYLKQTCLDYIQSPPLDENERILNTISCVISIIFSRGRIHHWSNGLMLLIEKLKDPVLFKVKKKKKYNIQKKKFKLFKFLIIKRYDSFH